MLVPQINQLSFLVRGATKSLCVAKPLASRAINSHTWKHYGVHMIHQKGVARHDHRSLQARVTRHGGKKENTSACEVLFIGYLAY